MKLRSLLGNKRRSAVGQAFLNIFTILVPAAVTSERFLKVGMGWKMALGLSLIAVLLLGWLITPKEDKPLEKDG